MQVSIQELDVQMEIKNQGIELEVYDTTDKHLGDLVITKTKLIRCGGGTRRNCGRPVSWEDFIRFMESQ